MINIFYRLLLNYVLPSDKCDYHTKMPQSVYGIAAFFVVLSIIIAVVQCCVRYMKSEYYGSQTSPPRSHSLYPVRRANRDNLSEEALLRPGSSGTQSRPNAPPAASPVVVPPYPVDARHPTPQTGPVPAGFATHNPPYPTQNPHPVGAPLYYPPPVGAAPYPPVAAPYPPVSGAAPYPPTGPPVPSSYDYSANPPSYSEAVRQPPIQPPPANEGYSKQSPYNPNY